MDLDIKTFRRFALAFISILFFGLAANSVAQGQVKVENTLYRVEIHGIYTHDWHDQSELYPRSDRVWSQSEGSVTSGFDTRGKGILFRGTRFTGQFPTGMTKPPFQFIPLARTVAKASNRAKGVSKFNQIPACGGELGECTGNEPHGVKTTRKSCQKPKAVLPFAFDYDEGVKDSMTFNFGWHKSNYDFCGKKYPFPDSVDELPKTLRVLRGLEMVAGLKRGQKQVWRISREHGEIRDESTDWEPKTTKKCPALAGTGVRRCWTIDMTLEVRRIK
jgi:hypothetical protein